MRLHAYSFTNEVVSRLPPWGWLQKNLQKWDVGLLDWSSATQQTTTSRIHHTVGQSFSLWLSLLMNSLDHFPQEMVVHEQNGFVFGQYFWKLRNADFLSIRVHLIVCKFLIRASYSKPGQSSHVRPTKKRKDLFSFFFFFFAISSYFQTLTFHSWVSEFTHLAPSKLGNVEDE